VPIYEYECDACGHRFEVIQKFSDDPIDVCPKCGERKVHKRLSSPAFQFKGSGWYITDYARKGGSGDAKTDDKGAAEKKTEKAEKPASTSTPPSTPSKGSSDKS
jgi:putative FmdB family regulatory protein